MSVADLDFDAPRDIGCDNTRGLALNWRSLDVIFGFEAADIFC